MLIHISIYTSIHIYILLGFVRSYECVTEFILISCHSFLKQTILKNDWGNGNFFLILKRVQNAEKYQQLLLTDVEKSDTYRMANSVLFSRW